MHPEWYREKIGVFDSTMNAANANRLTNVEISLYPSGDITKLKRGKYSHKVRGVLLERNANAGNA